MRSLLSKSHSVSRYTRKCNFIYFHKKRKTSAPKIFHESLQCLTELCVDKPFSMTTFRKIAEVYFS